MAGDFVVIPKSQTILLDTSTPVIKMILINGGKLIFDEKDIELQAENILINDGGALQVSCLIPKECICVISLDHYLKKKL